MRGGRRLNAGRKAKGITRKVSLTLTKEQWEQIEEFGDTVAAFIRDLMQSTDTKLLIENKKLREENEQLLMKVQNTNDLS